MNKKMLNSKLLSLMLAGASLPLGALAQGKIGSSAVEGAARNPGAASTVQTMMIIGLALIESLVLLALVIVFAKL